MTQKDKNLLFKDLLARLPYGVKVEVKNYKCNGEVRNVEIETLNVEHLTCPIERYRPYLRPLSSMVEEEKKEYIEYAGYEIEESVNGRHYEYYLKDFCGTPDNPSVNADGVDWLNKNMFDYRGLIPKDLALSTEVFNPYP